ncbi:MAG TPA: polyprenyl synthetase family protein [Bacteroidales bacterium]|nr:polyprenyl synthetase family protein [Bacteroidales bacterium]HNS46049.1 polyprenyl synthetase family protein [Bacteroidales bacterium]
MHSIETLQRIFSDALSGRDFDGFPPELYDPVKYTLSLGGKRLRPVLVLAGCDLFGRDVQKALLPAIGIELFHNFTLLHDDIMDQAPLRRGHPTVQAKWNANVAILSGDTLFALAYQHLLHCEEAVLPAVLEVFTKTAIEVCEGQQLDMNFEKQDDVPIQDYLVMIRLKTAVLLAGSLEIGSLIGGAGTEEARRLYECGLNMGMAFQLQDDLLDIFSDEALFGKITGGDIVANKKTYLYLKALEVAEGSDFDELKSLYHHPTTDQAGKVARITDLYSALKIKDHTVEAMGGYYARALEDLDRVRVHPDRKSALDSLIRGMRQRTF